MICTTVYGNIESILANLSDETEKEEVVALKAYLRQAIANFAAVGNSLNPPKILSHSRPTKGKGSGSGKGKNIELNIAVVIPQIPSPSQTQRAKSEEATNWATVLKPTVPAFIRKEHGEVKVINSILVDEVDRVCSVCPAHLKLYGGNKTEAPHTSCMAFFPKAPYGRFSVFDESGIARPFKKQQPLKLCKRCNGHNSIKICCRAPSYGNDGSTIHTEDLCMAATKCRNCGGSHRSDSRRCLARPTSPGAPTKEQLKNYRQAGEREFQAVLQAKAAEELAASDKTNNTELTCSQASEVDNDIDNIPASSVDLPTVDAMRI
ncbi:putative eka-like protein [Erysiphe necator]|uniref:Putative eka-like protein n=1 Tax=Uncinula necator TaxID=52586 RepID=A0A0B1PEI9_UNCNE|nr:putative eka-like protein [Erysiphe necator]